MQRRVSMPKAGDSYIVTLRENHLAWGTYRYTDSRTPRRGEAYLPIPMPDAHRFNIYNSNFTGGRDVLGENIFRCTSHDGFLNTEMKAQGSVREGNVYAKQFSVKGDLTAIGAWYRHVNAQPGDQIEVRWISDVEMTIRLI